MRTKTINLLTAGMMVAEAFIVLIGAAVVNKAYAFEFLGGASIICMIITAFLIYRLSKEIDFFFYFIVLAYLFSFGQSMLIMAGQELPVSAFSISYSGFTPDNILQSGVYSLIAINMVVIGYALSKKNTIKKTNCVSKFVDGIKVCKVGWLLLLVSIIPTFYLLYVDIKGTFMIGYGSTLVAYTGIERICSLISGFFTSGIIMILCFETRSLHRKFCIVLLGVYALLQLAGGSRISIFRLAILLLLIYGRYFKCINKKRAILIGVFGLLGVFVFSVVSASRIYVYDIANLSMFLKETANGIWKNNFLFSAIREMGNTQIINTLVYSACPSKVDFAYGFSFVKILWAILPNLMGAAYTGYIGVDITFSPLYTKTSAGLGASFISEGYWNFGYFGFLYFIIFGIALGRLERKYNSLCNSEGNKASSLFLVLYIIYYMIFMVRSELLGIGRAFVYYALIPVLLCKTKFK